MGHRILRVISLLFFFTISFSLLAIAKPAGTPITGTKTIGGTAPNYQTLKAALRDLTANGTTSPGVTFVLRNGSWFEDSLIVQTTTTSASAPVIITVDQGAKVTIYDSATVALPCVLKIINTPYVTIDGGANHSLTFNGIGANAQKGIIVSGSSQYAVIKNCIIKAGAYTATTNFAVELSSATALLSPNYSIIDNNVIRNAYYGIRLTGNSASDSLLNITVSNNLIDSVAQGAIYCTNTAKAQIFANDVSCLLGGTANMYGIYAGSGNDYMRIYNNKVHDLNQLSTSSGVTYGINNNAGSTLHGGVSIFNNFINISPSNNGTGSVYGIYSSEGSNTTADTVAYNTVRLTGSSAGIRYSNAYYKGSASGAAAIVVKNNILHNTRIDAAGSSVCAIGRISAASKMISDNNNLWVGTPDSTHKIGRISTGTSMLAYSTLADWKAGDTSDASSISENSPFVSATDLHIQKVAVTKLAGAASPLAYIVKDIDNENRSPTKPDIGADEFSNQAVPVELTSFSAMQNGSIIILNWVTATEKNNLGFALERKISDKWEQIAFVNGNGTTIKSSQYSIADNSAVLLTIAKVSYRLKQLDFDGAFTYSDPVEVNINNSPSEFELKQNYPNPFNPSTSIAYALQSDCNVKILVYNIIGQMVKELVNSKQTAGAYNIKFDASGFSSGVYFYSIEAKEIGGTKIFNSIRKAVLLK